MDDLRSLLGDRYVPTIQAAVLRAIPAAILALALAGCSSPSPAGFVTSHTHTAMWVSYTPVVIGKATILVPQVHPERWCVVLDTGYTGCTSRGPLDARFPVGARVDLSKEDV